MLKLKLGSGLVKEYKEPLPELARTLNDVDFCYAVLNKVRYLVMHPWTTLHTFTPSAAAASRW